MSAILGCIFSHSRRMIDVANEFVQRNENRSRNFGKFTDLDLSTC